jgi:hypothetical protein
MSAALHCAHCGTPVRGTRFCTTCGTPLPGPAREDTAQPLASVSHQPAEVVSGEHAQATVTSVLPAPAPVPVQPVAPWLSGQHAPQPARTRPNIIAILVVAALALSGWAIWRGVEQHTLSGTVLLVDSTYLGLAPGRPCDGEGGYGDLGGGAQVVLSDDRGATLSTGRLSAGEFDGLGCVFSFALEDVTRSDFYGLTVASGSRGELQYSYEELAEQDWSVQLSIGDDEW